MTIQGTQDPATAWPGPAQSPMTSFMWGSGTAHSRSALSIYALAVIRPAQAAEKTRPVLFIHQLSFSSVDGTSPSQLDHVQKKTNSAVRWARKNGNKSPLEIISAGTVGPEGPYPLLAFIIIY